MHERPPLYFAAATDSGTARTDTAPTEDSETFLDPRHDFIAFATTLVNVEKDFYLEELARSASKISIFDTPPQAQELSQLLGASLEILKKRSAECQKYLAKHMHIKPKEDPDEFKQKQAKTLATMVFFDALVFQLANEVTVNDFLVETFSPKFADDVTDYYSWKTIPIIAAELGYNEEMLRVIFAERFKDTRNRVCGKRYPNIPTLPPEMSDDLISIVRGKQLRHQEKTGKRTDKNTPSAPKERPTPLKLSFSDTVALHSRSNYKENLEDVANRTLALDSRRLPKPMSLGSFATMCGISMPMLNIRITALCNGFSSGFSYLDTFQLSKHMKTTDMLPPVTVAFLLFDLTYSGFRSIEIVKSAKRLFPDEIGDISEFHRWPTAIELAARYCTEQKKTRKFRSYSFTEWETAITQARTASLQKKNLRFGSAWTSHPNKRSHTFDPSTEQQFRKRVIQKLLHPDPMKRIKNRLAPNDTKKIGDFPARRVIDALIRARATTRSHTGSDDLLFVFAEKLGLPYDADPDKIRSLYSEAILAMDTRSALK